MNCPVCKDKTLSSAEIEPELFASVCETCGGKWIPFNSYENWLKSNDNLPLTQSENIEVNIPEFELARLCPECRRILVKYKVGKDVLFAIDRCGTCAGVWLDKGEWICLKNHDLHDDLQQIFTDYWQETIKKDETRQYLSNIFETKFGKEDYEKIADFKNWLETHPKKSEIVAYISDPNPLQF